MEKRSTYKITAWKHGASNLKPMDLFPYQLEFESQPVTSFEDVTKLYDKGKSLLEDKLKEDFPDGFSADQVTLWKHNNLGAYIVLFPKQDFKNTN